jgi:hypothetical protein
MNLDTLAVRLDIAMRDHPPEAQRAMLADFLDDMKAHGLRSIDDLPCEVPAEIAAKWLGAFEAERLKASLFPQADDNRFCEGWASQAWSSIGKSPGLESHKATFMSAFLCRLNQKED